jgi:ABC-type Fe3+/spermidine/putrescine transport system ATPase subunit
MTGPMAQTVTAASQTGSLLSIREVVKSFGSRPVLRNISLEVASGEFLTIPAEESAQGRRLCYVSSAGFEQLDGGEIWIGGDRLDQIPPIAAR